MNHVPETAVQYQAVMNALSEKTGDRMSPDCPSRAEVRTQILWFALNYVANEGRAGSHCDGGGTFAAGKGCWRTAYRGLVPGDLVLIRFGHNDASIRLPEIDRKRGHPEFVDVGFKERLRLYVSQSLEKGALPILVTPAARNAPWQDGVLGHAHKGFPGSVAEVAAGIEVPLLDLHKRSMEFLTAQGQEQVHWRYFVNLEPGEWGKYPEGLKDNTHFHNNGAVEVAKLGPEGLVDIAYALGRGSVR
ncbi:MAG: hypothetical protein CMJ58_03485 [Planctomycetaceae bacterium]|nr:hypothetical protein [Planctomycetaceae bacterium]